MRPLSESIARVSGQNFSRKFIALGRIADSWEDIIGKQMAMKAQPARILYRKPKTKGDKPRATLEIAAASADATLLHYQKDLILERMNQVFGERWITDIKFVAITANAPTKAKKAKRLLSADEKHYLSDFVSDIKDTDIRDRLESLGRGIWQHES